MLNRKEIIKEQLINKGERLIVEKELEDVKFVLVRDGKSLIEADKIIQIALKGQEFIGCLDENKRVIRTQEHTDNFYRYVAPKISDNEAYARSALISRTQKMLSENTLLEGIIDQMDEEYLDIVFKYLVDDKLLIERNCWHHEDKSALSHSLWVSFLAFREAKEKIAAKKDIDIVATTIGALFHDYYLYDWHIAKHEEIHPDSQSFFIRMVVDRHLWSHGEIAANNFQRDFPNTDMDPLRYAKIVNIISSHMRWPNLLFNILNIRKDRKQRYAECKIVSHCDRLASSNLAKQPFKNAAFSSSGNGKFLTAKYKKEATSEYLLEMEQDYINSQYRNLKPVEKKINHPQNVDELNTLFDYLDSRVNEEKQKLMPKSKR